MIANRAQDPLDPRHSCIRRRKTYNDLKVHTPIQDIPQPRHCTLMRIIHINGKMRQVRNVLQTPPNAPQPVDNLQMSDVLPERMAELGRNVMTREAARVDRQTLWPEIDDEGKKWGVGHRPTRKVDNALANVENFLGVVERESARYAEGLYVLCKERCWSTVDSVEKLIACYLARKGDRLVKYRFCPDSNDNGE